MEFFEETNDERIIDAMRSFCTSKASINRESLIIRENGKITQIIPLRDLYITLEKRIELFYENFINIIENLEKQGYGLNEEENEKKLSLENNSTKLNYGYSDFASLILTYQKAVTKLKTNTKAYSNFESNIVSYIEKLRQRMDKYDFSRYVMHSAIMAIIDPNLMKYVFNDDTTYSVDEAAALTKRFAEKDFFKVDMNFTSEIILISPTEFLRKLEKNGYLEPQRNINYPADMIQECEKDLNYESRFLSTKSCISAYYYGLIDLKHLKKNFNVMSLFNSKFLAKTDKLDLIDDEEKNISFIENKDNKVTYKEHGKMIMEIMDEVEPEETFSIGFWNYYINGILSNDDITKLIEGGYLYVDEILSKFMDRHTLAEELEGDNNNKKQDNSINKSKVEKKETFHGEEVEYIFDDEKTYEIFNPNMLIYCYCDDNTDKIKNIADRYINKYLNKYYKKRGRDVSDEFMKSAYKVFEEHNPSEDEKVRMLIRLYDEGIIRANNLKDERISDSVIQSIFKHEIDNNSAVIDFYNNGLISSDKILGEFDEDKLIDLINEGMDVSVIREFYSIEEVITRIIKKLKRACDLSFYRDDFSFEKIKKMYQPSYKNETGKGANIIDKLTYDDLETIVTCGILTEEEADEIDQEYDYNSKVNMLIEKGILVVGNKYGEKPARNSGMETKKKESNYGPGKIDEEDKQLLYLSLGDEYTELTIVSDILKKYKLVIIPKLKIAMMEPSIEGTGASYIMSIKLALDQICNDIASNNDEKVIDPLKAYGNRTGIRSIPGIKVAYHDEEWGYRIKEKMAKIHPNLENLIYVKDTESEKIERRKNISEIQEEIRQQYIITRNKKKDISNQNK